ncbi:MAG: hypothetical protein J0G32_06745 [Alphaproteobacteria bacterium]|nr:hypothetical protein [Alphaproteobacteria bacterium]OJV14168.1 MAG: hypothetical protein BGO27_01560 [Alphaproteobacteria bacterium 33-17]
MKKTSTFKSFILKLSCLAIAGGVIGAALPYIMPVALPMTNSVSSYIGGLAIYMKAGTAGVSYVYDKGAWVPKMVPTIIINKSKAGAFVSGILGASAASGMYSSIYGVYKSVEAAAYFAFSKEEHKQENNIKVSTEVIDIANDVQINHRKIEEALVSNKVVHL